MLVKILCGIEENKRECELLMPCSISWIHSCLSFSLTRTPPLKINGKIIYIYNLFFFLFLNLIVSFLTAVAGLTDTDDKEETEDSDLYTIIGAASGVLLILILFILMLTWFRRRKFDASVKYPIRSTLMKGLFKIYLKTKIMYFCLFLIGQCLYKTDFSGQCCLPIQWRKHD